MATRPGATETALARTTASTPWARRGADSNTCFQTTLDLDCGPSVRWLPRSAPEVAPTRATTKVRDQKIFRESIVFVSSRVSPASVRGRSTEPQTPSLLGQVQLRRNA